VVRGGRGMSACAACLRRSHLIGHLAPRIASLLDRPRRRPAGLMSLSEAELIDAVAGPRAAEAWRFLERFDAQAAGERIEAGGLGALCLHARAYPGKLRDLADPPAVLYLTGEEERLAELAAEPAVAIVGARRASPYGLEMAHAMGRGLSAARVTVVSGLALGVDAAAHRGALEGGSSVLAVVAGGADIPYPKRNRRLHARIREEGAVLSESPPGQRPLRWSFPARNRLMAGLADLTLVVEAARPSGSLITAEFAQDLGRTVAAVPGRATSRTAAGTNSLLRDGAALVTCTGDVLEELFGVGHAHSVELPRPTEDLPEELAGVLAAVESEATVDGMARAAELPVGAVRAALARLEASGHIRRVGLAAYERTALMTND
jgi:DNA processing protein